MVVFSPFGKVSKLDLTKRIASKLNEEAGK